MTAHFRLFRFPTALLSPAVYSVAALLAACAARTSPGEPLAQTSASPGAPEGSTVETPQADAAAPDAGVNDAGASGDAADGVAAPQTSRLDASAFGEAGEASAPPPCDPGGDPKDEPCLVSESFGVFVASSGADGAAGTRQDPLRTLGEGLALALTTGKARVFVCSGTYPEPLALGGADGDTSVYGGFDCGSGWSWTGRPAALAPAATASMPSIPLRVSATATAITLEDLSIAAPDAHGQDPSGAGLSSVAAWFSGATATLRRVTLAAGQGAAGSAGPDGAPNSAPAASALFVTGALGSGAQNLCPYGSSTGGSGGSSSLGFGFPGTGGTASPLPLASDAASNGAGGVSVSSEFVCPLPAISNGNAGASGYGGSPGGRALAYGGLAEDAWHPSAGSNGSAGDPGQGGGGGAGGALILGLSSYGGGAGAGGCGGAGGRGGQGGGASFALVSLQSSLTLSACTLSSAAAGPGGAGGSGAPGQPGGAGAPGGDCGGSGGPGGAGAPGAGGAGGSGGVSAAIAYEGPAPLADSATTLSPGSLGAPGPGGGPAGQDGDVGLSGLSIALLTLETPDAGAPSDAGH